MSFFGIIILILAVGLVLYIWDAVRKGTLRLQRGAFTIAIIERSRSPFEFAASVAGLSLVAVVAIAGGILSFFI